MKITVLSRSGNVPAGVRSVVGSATDPAVVREAIAGADAVVVTVGGTIGVRRVLGPTIDAARLGRSPRRCPRTRLPPGSG